MNVPIWAFHCDLVMSKQKLLWGSEHRTRQLLKRSSNIAKDLRHLAIQQKRPLFEIRRKWLRFKDLQMIFKIQNLLAYPDSR